MNESITTEKKQDIARLNANQGLVQFENIPQELKDLTQWVLWIWGWNKDGTKLTKVPKTFNQHGSKIQRFRYLVHFPTDSTDIFAADG